MAAETSSPKTKISPVLDNSGLPHWNDAIFRQMLDDTDGWELAQDTDLVSIATFDPFCRVRLRWFVLISTKG